MLIQRGLLHQPLQHQARHDAKTGLLNSEAWRAAASSALCQARREGRQLAVPIVDVDHFKVVNDTHGHLIGDEVRTRAANAIAITDAADTGSDLPGLIATADQALYQAKTAGRDQVCVRAA